MSDLARALVDALDDDALEALTDLLAPRIAARIAPAQRTDDGWLGTRAAADYLAISANAVHKLTAAREIPFEQDCPGGKCWFKRSELDAWRRGEWKRERFLAA